MEKLKLPLDWVGLPHYIELLLKQGKRSKDPEFKQLFNVFGEKKIREMAEATLKKWKEEKSK